jgi:hypothetical protein
MTALIFTLHPQRVESVAWLCERKDCLAMFLGAAALLLFWRALEKDKISWGSACCLLLSFLAKPMWLFFFVPAAALIWMKKRAFPLGFALKQLFPSLLLFLLFAATLVWNVVSNQGDASLFDKGTFLLKIETVLYNYGNYFLRTFLPGNLFPLYPYYDPAAAPRWMALIPVALLFTPFLMKQEEFRPAILFGVLPLLICFAALLLPVVGFVDDASVFALVINIGAVMLFQSGAFIIGSQRAAILSTFEPITSLIVGYFAFSEAVTPLSILGSVLVLAASVVTALGDGEEKTNEEKNEGSEESHHEK